jgi:hypothetical protein
MISASALLPPANFYDSGNDAAYRDVLLREYSLITAENA